VIPDAPAGEIQLWRWPQRCVPGSCRPLRLQVRLVAYCSRHLTSAMLRLSCAPSLHKPLSFILAVIDYLNRIHEK